MGEDKGSSGADWQLQNPHLVALHDTHGYHETHLTGRVLGGCGSPQARILFSSFYMQLYLPKVTFFSQPFPILHLTLSLIHSRNMGVFNCEHCADMAVVDNITCDCKYGYMNEEGTFIPGSLVRHRYVLSKQDYQDHKSCNICPTHPERCSFRRSRIPDHRILGIEYGEAGRAQEGKRSLESPWPYKEFFIPSKGIDLSILERYNSVNGGRDDHPIHESRTFKVSMDSIGGLWCRLICHRLSKAS